VRLSDQLLLGEWACLGVLADHPAHGYDVSLRLAPDGDAGRVWSLSRPLTYRALDQLQQRQLVAVVGEERGKAGGMRTILSPTRRGRSALRRWLAEPVDHFRDVRGELLLKLVLCELAGVDRQPLLEAQRRQFTPMIEALATDDAGRDPVAAWREESSRAAMRFIDRMLTTTASSADRRPRRPRSGRGAPGRSRSDP
jgi:DNA-binding PadR family transcriptional regulator